MTATPVSPPEATNLSQNLKFLCGREGSVSEVCRMLDINRQQFARYINGSRRPSYHNLQRICDHFEVNSADLDLDPAEFTALAGRTPPVHRATRSAFEHLFQGQIKPAREHLGRYLVYHRMVEFPDHVAVYCCALKDLRGQVQARSIRRGRHPVLGTRFIAKYDGRVTAYRDRLYLYAGRQGGTGPLSLDILTQSTWFGAGTFVSLCLTVSANTNDPLFGTKFWRRASDATTDRELLGACGIHALSSRGFDPRVRAFLEDETNVPKAFTYF